MITPEPAWRLTEEQVRAKLIELFDMCSQRRLEMWMISGTATGVLDPDVVERVAREEILKRSHEVQHYWLNEPCNCMGQMN